MYNILKMILFFDKFILNWGPAVHLHVGNQLLKEDGIKGEKKRVIHENKEEFLYGNLAPDITLGKKYIRDAEKHSHIWKTAFNILDKAKTDKQKALAYGYLSHLASDVIAHNYYVPKELLHAEGLRNFSHLLSEIRVDMMLYHDVYELIQIIIKRNFKKEDRFLKPLISKSILPFGINKRLLQYSLRITKSKTLYRVVSRTNAFEEWEIRNQKVLKKYHNISKDLAKNLLINMENSKALEYDPNGEAHIERGSRETIIKKGDRAHTFHKIPDELISAITKEKFN
ncbi:MAG: zinc dependent phospholipase C family protein [Fusobacteriota bacterium]